MKRIFATAIACLPLVLSSCLKDNEVEDRVYGLEGAEDTKLVELSLTPLDNSNFKAEVFEAINRDTTVNAIPLTFVFREPAPEDIRVVLMPSTALIGEYNSQTGSTIEAAPATRVSVIAPTTTDGGYVVTIPKGQRKASLQVKFKPSDLLGFNYGIAFKIARIENAGYTISRNYSTAIVNLVIKNAYDGVYSYKGYSLRAGDAALTGYFSGKTMGLETKGATVVGFTTLALWGDGNSQIAIDKPQLSINTSGTPPYPVTISSIGGGTNAPGYNSRYDPATKTFYISFTWGAGPAARLSTDTLTYLRPR